MYSAHTLVTIFVNLFSFLYIFGMLWGSSNPLKHRYHHFLDKRLLRFHLAASVIVALVGFYTADSRFPTNLPYVPLICIVLFKAAYAIIQVTKKSNINLHGK